MTEEIGGCFKIPEKAVVPTNWVAVISVIVGLATAILAQTAAQHLHTHSVYFFAPGMGVAGLGVLAVIIVNCCRRETEQHVKPVCVGGTDESASPSPANKTTDSQKAGKAPSARPTANIFTSKGSNRPRFCKMKSAAEYRVQDVYHHEKACPGQYISPPVTIGALKENLLSRHPDNQANILSAMAPLEQSYFFQVIEGDGNCLYYSLISGMLHHMVATKSQKSLRSKLEELAKDIADSDVHKICEEIDKIDNLEKLWAFLTNKTQMLSFVLLLRKITHRQCPCSSKNKDEQSRHKDILLQNQNSDLFPEGITITHLLGGHIYLSSTVDSYESLKELVSNTGVPDPHFAILFNGNHYDALLTKSSVNDILRTGEPANRRALPNLPLDPDQDIADEVPWEENDLDLQEAIVASLSSDSDDMTAAVEASLTDAPQFFPAMNNVQDYVVGTQYQGEKIPGQRPVHHPLSIQALRTHLEQSTTKAEQFPTQMAHLEEHYLFQVVRGDGKCFYYALISGMLHHMLATNSNDSLKDQLCAHLGDAASRFEDTLKEISAITDISKLVIFLTSHSKMNSFVLLLRQIAYNNFDPDLPGDPADTTHKNNILKSKEYAELYHEARQMVTLFGGQLYVSTEIPGYELIVTEKSFDSQTGMNTHTPPENAAFAVIFRRNHYDALLTKSSVKAIGIPGVEATLIKTPAGTAALASLCTTSNRDMISLKEYLQSQTPNRADAIETQFAHLGEGYTYWVAPNNHISFSFALVYGLLHDMVANQNPLLCRLEKLAWEKFIDDRIETSGLTDKEIRKILGEILSIIHSVDGIKMPNKLIQNQDNTRPLAFFLNEIATHRLKKNPSDRDRGHLNPNIRAAMEMVHIFGASLYISADHPDYADIVNNDELFDPDTGQMLPAQHNSSFGVMICENRCICLLSVEMLAKIGISDAESSGVPQRS